MSRREISATLEADGTGGLVGIGLVPRPPFTSVVVAKLYAQLVEQAATGRLFVSLSDGFLLPFDPWKVRLADVAATVERVAMAPYGEVEIVAKLLTTPRGGQVREYLRSRRDAGASSGIAFTTFAMGHTNAEGIAGDDARAVSIHIVRSDMVE